MKKKLKLVKHQKIVNPKKSFYKRKNKNSETFIKAFKRIKIK